METTCGMSLQVKIRRFASSAQTWSEIKYCCWNTLCFLPHSIPLQYLKWISGATSYSGSGITCKTKQLLADYRYCPWLTFLLSFKIFLSVTRCLIWLQLSTLHQWLTNLPVLSWPPWLCQVGQLVVFLSEISLWKSCPPFKLHIAKTS